MAKLVERIPELADLKWQEINAVSHNANSEITGIRFSNLEVGKTYRYNMFARINGSGVANYNIIFNNNLPTFRLTDDSGQGGDHTYSRVFVADTTTLTATMSITDAGGGVTFYVQLEELPFHNSTTQWT